MKVIMHNLIYTSKTLLTAYPTIHKRQNHTHRASLQRVRPTRIAARPETHQPLHTDKEQTKYQTKPRSRRRIRAWPRPKPVRLEIPSRDEFDPCSSKQASTPKWWRRTGSNRRPPACKAGALPAELRPHAMVCARQSKTQRLVSPYVVGQGGLEPPTPRLSSVCSNQLSY
jgi:hypothetical protein